MRVPGLTLNDLSVFQMYGIMYYKRQLFNIAIISLTLHLFCHLIFFFTFIFLFKFHVDFKGTSLIWDEDIKILINIRANLLV